MLARYRGLGIHIKEWWENKAKGERIHNKRCDSGEEIEISRQRAEGGGMTWKWT